MHFTNFIAKTIDGMKEVFCAYDVSVDVPPVVQYIMYITDKQGTLGENILKVRESRHARAFRKWCSELQEATGAGSPGVAKAKRLHNELETACTVWAKDLDNHVRYRRRPLKIKSLLSLIGFEIELTVKDPIMFGSDLKHMLFLNDLLRAVR